MSYVPALLRAWTSSAVGPRETSATLEGIEMWPAVCSFDRGKHNQENINSVVMALLSPEAGSKPDVTVEVHV